MYESPSWYYEKIGDQADDFDAACRLIDLMSDISETCYCAGWMNGLEYTLWESAQDFKRPHSYGMGTITLENAWELRRLSEKAGGWWRWDEETEETFVSLSAWKQHLDEQQ